MSHQPTTVTPWGRGRLLATLTGVALVGLGLLTGFVLAIHSAAVHPGATASGSTSASSLPTGRDERRDVLAAEPMLYVNGTDSTQGVPAATPGPTMEVPGSSTMGAGKVASGFPHTPQGAIGQLAAIEVAVLTEMSIARTNEIYLAWSADDAAPVDQWRLTRHVQAFLAASNMGPAKDPNAIVTITPVAAQTKATDGPDWTIACVLVDVRAVIRQEARMAYGYCERMQWDAGRWVIAPGTPPADAPSTWPGTDLAFQAGWQTWTPDNP